MENDIFSMNNFSVIDDKENYYIFRALEPYDIRDIDRGRIEKKDILIDKLRTYRERYNETHKTPSRYDESAEISLDEVWSHIKKNMYPGTNCISFSTNSNVCLDYGKNTNSYAMIKVPKNNPKNVYLAGQYMLEELDKRLEKVVSNLTDADELIESIKNIKSTNSNTELLNIINDYSREHNISIDYMQRFNSKQYFNDVQELNYNKIIGKLTLLEMANKIDNILPRTSSNMSLISTISMAFSSGEVINYKSEFENGLISISPVIVQLFSLIQQAESMGYDKQQIEYLKSIIINYVNNGYDLKEYNGEIIFGNNSEFIKFNPTMKDILLDKNSVSFDKNISVDDIFKVTNGSIPYKKAVDALEFAFNTSLAKEKTNELTELLKIIAPRVDNDFLDNIKQNCYVVNSNIISRVNNNGKKICESVNIDMNQGIGREFNNAEQNKMLSYINNLNRYSINGLLESNALDIEKTLCDNILDKGEVQNLNSYYAQTIVDNIDFNKIYNNRELNVVESQKALLKERLEQGNCIKLYKSFERFNIPKDLMSSFIINLLIENGFKDYNFNELSQLENLDDLIEKNINNFNGVISALKLDRVFNIKDNYNLVSYKDDNNIDRLTKINLRDYQQDAVNMTDALFEDKRFAGVVLPTGGGKSFVAMAEMLKYRKKNILYYAPNQGILDQMAEHILKNIVGLSSEEITKLYDSKEPPLKSSYLPRNVEAIISSVFPHLKLYCYQSTLSKDDDFFKSHDADLIVFDELHRTGATEWNKRIKKLIESNPNSKILGITATPIRDVDQVDMMEEFAKLTGDYTKKEIVQKKYLASNLTLIDAMQLGIVVVPNIITFDYTLENSNQYKTIKRAYESSSGEEKETLKEIYDEMRKIVENSKKLGVSSIVKNAFDKNLKKENGRYIIFLPMNNEKNMDSEEYILSQIEEVKKYFSQIDSNPEIDYLSSKRNDKLNIEAMNNFKKDSGHLKLLFAINMLNEGIHVSDIDGSMMLRPIGPGSKILYLQQFGRCVFALDPNNILEDDKVPMVFDVYNNYLEQEFDREVNKSNSTSDLQKMRNITSWIIRHKGYFPDINSDNLEEVRKASMLKKIQVKYSRYLSGSINGNLSPTEQYEIDEIISLGKRINLWEVDIPERVFETEEEKQKELEKNLIRINTFKLTGEQKRFIDLYKQGEKSLKNKRKVGVQRIRDTMYLLNLLSQYGFEINNLTIPLNMKLNELYSLLPDDVVDAIKEEIDLEYDFNIGEEYNYAKQMFYNKNKCFLEYSVKELRNSGIFCPFYKRSGKLDCSVDDRGFITRGPEKFLRLNQYTSTYRDIDGLDNMGYDELHFLGKEAPYNMYDFDRNGINKATNTNLNEYNFDINCDYYEKLPDGTLQNKGKYDPFGFAINKLWYRYKIDEDGKENYVFTGSLRDEDGYNIDGLDENGFDRNHIFPKTGTKYDNHDFDYKGINKYTGTKYDKRGFNISCIHLNGTKYDDKDFDIDGINKVTGTKYNKKNFDALGINKDTNKPYDEHYFDIDGYLWELQSGKYVKTFNKYNERGFDCNLVNKETNKRYDREGYDIDDYNRQGYDRQGYDREGYTKDRIDKYGFNINHIHKKTGTKYNERGFDIDFIHKKTGTKYDERGFDINLIHEKTGTKYDERGFDADFIHEKTGMNFDELRFDYNKMFHKSNLPEENPKPYDINGFDFDGYYWEIEEDGKRHKTDKKYNPYGYDSLGNYVEIVDDIHEKLDFNGFDKNGIFKETGLDYNERFFKADGTNIYTGKKYDINGFDINGMHYITKTYCTGRGFDRNGINCQTGTKYDEHDLDIYRNPPFNINDNHVPYEVYVTKKYFEEMYVSQTYKNEIYNSIAKKFGLKTIPEIEIKLSELMIKGIFECPDLKLILTEKIQKMNKMIDLYKYQLKKAQERNSQAGIKNYENKINSIYKDIDKFSKFIR